MRKHILLLSALIILSVIFKIFLLLFSNYAIQPDSQGFLENAALFKKIDFHNLNVIFPWLYSVFIALLSFLIPNLEICGNIVSIIFSAFLLVPLFYLTLWIFNKKVAILSCLLAIFYPWLNLYSIAVTSETTYITMVMLGITLGWFSWKSNSKILYLCCGILMGLVYLTREEGVGYGAMMFLWFILLAIKKRFKNHSILNAIIYLIPFISLVFLYILFLYWHTGAWVLTAQMGNVAIEIESANKLVETKLDLVNSYVYVLIHLKEFALKYLCNLKDAFVSALPTIVSPILLCIGAIGFWARRWSREDKYNRVYLLLFMSPPFLLIPISHILSRYFLSILPLFLTLVAAGIEEIKFRAKEDSIILLRKPIVVGVVFFFLILGSLSPVFRIAFKLLPTYEIEYKKTGLWIKDNLPKNAVLFSQVGVIDYYAQRKRVLIRQPGKSIYDTRDIDEILSLAKQNDLNYYLVVQQRWKSTTLNELLDENKQHKRLKRVYVNNEFPEAKVVVYEIEK